MLLARELTERVIGLAIEVHRLIGPGMLESVYEGCLCYELGQAGIAFERQTGIPVAYKGVQFDEGFRADVLVDRQLILEIKAVASILPAHEAQLLTYLRMSGLRLGLLFNFHARLLKGIRPASAALPRGSGV
jgi:GxxExxY protein